MTSSPGVAVMEARLAVPRVVGGAPAGCRESRRAITVPLTSGGTWVLPPEVPTPLPLSTLDFWPPTSGKPQLGQRRGRISAPCGGALSPGTQCGSGSPSKKPCCAPPGRGGGGIWLSLTLIPSQSLSSSPPKVRPPWPGVWVQLCSCLSVTV